jgi:hypothetical protein
MTLDQQIAGTRSAIRALRSGKGGPTWLVPSLQKRLRALEAELKRRRYAKKI